MVHDLIQFLLICLSCGKIS